MKPIVERGRSETARVLAAGTTPQSAGRRGPAHSATGSRQGHGQKTAVRKSSLRRAG